MLLFGGQTSEGSFTLVSGTFAWGPSGWHRLVTTDEPSLRLSPAMVWYPPGGYVLLFGASVIPGSRPPTDTWKWDGLAWTQLHPLHAPSEADSPSIAYDPISRRAILSGGVYGPSTGGPAPVETWTWDGQDWSLQRTAHTPDYGQLTLAFDPVTQHVVMTGIQAGGPNGTSLPQMWSWDGQMWSGVGPAVPKSTWQIVADPGTNHVLAITAYPGTWEWSGMGWQRLEPDGANNLTPGAAVTWDPAVGRVVETGVTHDGKTFTDEVFGWDGMHWSLVTPATGVMSVTPTAAPVGSTVTVSGQACNNAGQPAYFYFGNQGGLGGTVGAVDIRTSRSMRMGGFNSGSRFPHRCTATRAGAVARSRRGPTALAACPHTATRASPSLPSSTRLWRESRRAPAGTTV